MVDVSVTLSWLLSMLKITVFVTVFAFSIVLVRVSKLKEIKFFALAALALLLASLFELVSTTGYFGTEFEIVEESFSVTLSKLFLLGAAILFIMFFYYVNKSIKQYI